MVKVFFISVVLLISMLASMSHSFASFRLDREKFIHLTLSEQKALITQTMKLIVEIESRYQYEVRKNGSSPIQLKKYTQLIQQLQSLILSSAYADSSSDWNKHITNFTSLIKKPGTCIYAGWISKLNSAGLCTHPANLPKVSVERKAYKSGCREPSQISCNPIIFGYKKIADSSSFCVDAGPSNGNAHNASLKCMQKALADPNEGDKKDDRLAAMAKEISATANKEGVKNLHDFISLACICPTGPVNLSSSYQQRIQPHRTCYGLMKMISDATTFDGCSSPVETNNLELIKKVQEKLLSAEDSTTDYDSFYSGFLLDIKDSSEYKNFCKISPDANPGVSTIPNGSNGPNNPTGMPSLGIPGSGTPGTGTNPGETSQLRDPAVATPTATPADPSQVRDPAVANPDATPVDPAQVRDPAVANPDATPADPAHVRDPAVTNPDATPADPAQTPATLEVSGNPATAIGTQPPANGTPVTGLPAKTAAATTPVTTPTPTTASASADKPETEKPADSTSEFSLTVKIDDEAVVVADSVDLKATTEPSTLPSDVTLIWYSKGSTETVEVKKTEVVPVAGTAPAAEPAAATSVISALPQIKDATAADEKRYDTIKDSKKIQVKRASTKYQMCAKLLRADVVVGKESCVSIDPPGKTEPGISLSSSSPATAEKITVVASLTPQATLAKGITILWFTRSSVKASPDTTPLKGMAPSNDTPTETAPEPKAERTPEKIAEETGVKKFGNVSDLSVDVDRKPVKYQVCATLIEGGKEITSEACYTVEVKKNKPGSSNLGPPTPTPGPFMSPIRGGPDFMIRGVQ